MDSCKYFSLSYKVIWRESMDSCKIPMGESKWILVLAREFLTLNILLFQRVKMTPKSEFH